MYRRHFLATLATAPVLFAIRHALGAAMNPATSPDVAALQRNWQRLLAPGSDVAALGSTLSLSNDEWRKKLTPDQYRVLREEGTEYPGSSPLNDEHRQGVFICAGCALPLFTSAMKFDSGTGWPSFFTTIPGAFAQKVDHKLIVARDEYHCSRCGGHHGHVFDDGPPPTHQRWCNNGVALRFIPKSA